MLGLAEAVNDVGTLACPPLQGANASRSSGQQSHIGPIHYERESWHSVSSFGAYYYVQPWCLLSMATRTADVVQHVAHHLNTIIRLLP